MMVSRCVKCPNFPCTDVRNECFIVPDVEVDPDKISMVMISEAAPSNPDDYFYAEGNPLYLQTTLRVFNDAGVQVSSMKDLLDKGLYLTTAVKCGKTGYGIKTATIKECSFLLKKELDLFPRVKVFMLMGDVAIKAFNEISKRAEQGRVIPAGSTYKIRKQEFWFRGARVFPSYLQVGQNFLIEKSKQRMVVEDIREAVKLIP